MCNGGSYEEVELCSMVLATKEWYKTMQVYKYLLHNVHTFVCPSSTKTSKFTDEMVLVEGVSCGCLPACEETDYQYSMTSSKLRWVFYLEAC